MSVDQHIHPASSLDLVDALNREALNRKAVRHRLRHPYGGGGEGEGEGRGEGEGEGEGEGGEGGGGGGGGGGGKLLTDMFKLDTYNYV